MLPKLIYFPSPSYFFLLSAANPKSTIAGKNKPLF